MVAPVERYRGDWSTIYEGDAREVAAMQEPGSFSLAILDGPFALGKAAWDSMSLDGLADWYRPHLEDVDRLCAASASLYVWSTSRSLKRLDPLIRSMGWTERGEIVWDKGLGAMAGKVDTEGLRCWYDVTEVCGFYQREAWAPGERIMLARRQAGLTRQQLATAVVGTPSGAVWNWENGQQCTPENYAHAMRACGDSRHTFELMAEHEASRPAFTCPVGVSNVWRHPQVSGRERLRAADGSTLHPCQKPLLFAERMIRASTRPGERVWAPFGGTLREAVACERIGRADPSEGRFCVTAELNQDGPDYIGAVLPSLRLELPQGDDRQPSLFGGAA